MVSVVAFLQCPWFPKETKWKHIEQYQDDQIFHQRLLAGTMTGKRLRTAFNELFPEIWWDNAHWLPTWAQNGPTHCDYNHMIGVIKKMNPEIVLTFGRIATSATTYLPMAMRTHLACHHPNARFKTQKDLNDFAQEVRETIKQAESGILTE